MLKELSVYDEFGGSQELVCFIKMVMGSNKLLLEDIIILSKNISGARIRPNALIDLLLSIEIMVYDEDTSFYYIAPAEKFHTNCDLRIISKVIEKTLKLFFDKNLLVAKMFSFDDKVNRIKFCNELFPLKYYALRNLLVSLGFLEVERRGFLTNFFVNPEYDSYAINVIQGSRRTKTLEELRSQLENNIEAGEIAEAFVLKYEVERLGVERGEGVRQISLFDVSAGYDITSFETASSRGYDRFIEVKSISKGYLFYWSKNEIDIAKAKQDKYFLYLVDLSKINNELYKPYIIKNPAQEILSGEKWLLESQNFMVKMLSE